MVQLSDILTKGVLKIYSDDLETQTHFLKVFCESVRNAKLETLLELKCFFVPNPEYLAEYFGPEITDPRYGVYVGEVCTWSNLLVIPIFNVAKECVAFVGHNFLQKLEDKETGENNGPYYITSNRNVFRNTDYLFYAGDSFDRAFEDGYIIIVDGMFDAINLYANGFNVCSMLGSRVTPNRMMQLRFIDEIFVAPDNDKAGNTLLKEIRKFRPEAKEIRQTLAKDADGAISSNLGGDYLKKVCISIKGGVSLIERPRRKVGGTNE